MKHSFGVLQPFQIGIEEEFMLVDPETLKLSNTSNTVLDKIGHHNGHVGHEFYQSTIETRSPVCPNTACACDSLLELRQSIANAGATFFGAGLHPITTFGDVAHVQQDRFASVDSATRGLSQITPVCALHVHIGMPDPETAVKTLNGLREFLPLFQALAANSPYWFGRDSGFASARANLFRAHPRTIIPQAFSNWDEFTIFVEHLVKAADIPDYTQLWWDIRLHPKLGTVEVRAMDSQSSLQSVLAIGGLIRCLAIACAEKAVIPSTPAEVIAESSFRASRDGIRATIWWNNQLSSIQNVLKDAIKIAKSYAADAGEQDSLAELQRFIGSGNGADKMRSCYHQGGMDAVMKYIITTTMMATTLAP